MTRARGTVLVACAVLLAACPPDDEGSPKVTGTFSVTSTMDIRVANVLPTPIYDKLEVLRALRDDPGDTFFDLLEEAGLPLVNELRAALPDSVEDKVGEWIDDAIPDSAKMQIDALLLATEASLGKFDLLSELTLPAADSGGRAQAQHALKTIHFTIDSRAIDLPVPASTGPLVTSTSVPAVLQKGGENGADARLSLAEHSFGVLYGEFAYQLIEQHVMARFGADLRGLLGTLIDCPAVAEAVSKKCLLSVCVGHKEQLEQLCVKGLDAAVAKLHAKLAEMRTDAIVFTSGAADLWDDRGDDGVIDLLDSGVWQASVNLGQGLRPIPATFVGARR